MKKMVRYKLPAVVLSVLLFGISREAVPARSDSNTTRVLFIGSSYTYYHSIPHLFRAAAEQRFPGHRTEVVFVGHGGATLKQQWEEGRALQEIRSAQWDYIVLQEQSMLGGEIMEGGKSYVRNPDQFYEFARKFNRAIRNSGAETVFYMTWSRRDYPHQQKYLTYAYMSIARETGSLIAPVGIAWEKLRTKKSFDLYDRDGSHPAIHGAYTAALMLFAVIFDTVPTGIPGRLEGHEILRGGKISETKSLLCELTDRDAKIIAESVFDILEQIKIHKGYLKVEKAISDKKPSQLSYIFNFLTDAKGQFIVLMITIGIVTVWKCGFNLFKNHDSTYL